MALIAAGSNAISWNIVNKNLSPGITVKNKLSRKIAVLAKHLVHFPPRNTALAGGAGETGEERDLHRVAHAACSFEHPPRGENFPRSHRRDRSRGGRAGAGSEVVEGGVARRLSLETAALSRPTPRR
jgi:hypothetical protein